MRRGKQWFNRLGVRLFLLFVGSSFILMLVLTMLYYQRSAIQVNDKVGDVALKSMSQASGHAELLLKGYSILAKSIVSSPEIQTYAARDQKDIPALQAIRERTITNALGAIYYSWDDIIGIYVITDTGKVYSYGSRNAQVIDVGYKDTLWYDQIKQSKGEPIWLGVKDKSIIDQIEKRPVFAFGSQLVDFTNQKSMGIILVEMEPKAINGIMKNLELSNNSESFLLNSDKAILAHNIPNHIATSIARDIADEHDSKPVQIIDHDRYLIVNGMLNSMGLQLLSLTPKSDLAFELQQTKQFILMIFMLLIFLSILLALFVSRSVSLPISQMIRQMKQVERGDFNGMMEVKSFEEIREMAQRFNRMVDRINGLIARIRAISASEKNVQLQVLQAQVNPHFLYNTLDMIYWMLEEKEEETLSEVVLSLSEIFRYSSNWEHSSSVTLLEELEQIKNYALICQTRMNHRLEIKIEIDPIWHEIKLPKMILQPIVENAIVHGLDEKDSDEAGVVLLTAHIDAGNLYIHIEDNGVGMEQDKLKSLLSTLHIKSEKERAYERKTGGNLEEVPEGQAEDLISIDLQRESDTGIGLSNVHRRLLLWYGPAYGVQIRSTFGEGTRVSIIVPAILEEERA
ncbi:sensor histidine kinase [Paenibacillus sp. PL91]|uniref:sensor histidine kinase n=1 Tax=Paenibacillus sp. PL91 TaxID=2729538 RepID=UPI00145DC8C7|nr:sensor histidine kinase [Paenibacillus sp. PL91]MBC9200839.1 sensor histidine kinase [Paenibacillus sp. PL91]